MALLADRVAIITGASKGIGRALSLRFAREGARVVCAARSADLVKETTAQVQAAGGRAIAVVCDAAVEADVRRLVESAVQAFGRIDALVNNAGDGGPTKRVQDYLMEDWRYTIDSCLTSSYLCTRFVVPEMIKVGGGAIVNISSGAGRRGLPFRIGYCSAKAGQVGMTYGMALELARELRGARRRRGRPHRSRHRRPGRGEGNLRGGDAQGHDRTGAAQAHGDRRRHRGCHGVLLQRHGPQHLGAGPGGQRGRTGRLTPPGSIGSPLATNSLSDAASARAPSRERPARLPDNPPL
jgi:3-oxoacyl-[acyl-carrier protein] reductase